MSPRSRTAAESLVITAQVGGSLASAQLDTSNLCTALLTKAADKACCLIYPGM